MTTQETVRDASVRRFLASEKAERTGQIVAAAYELLDAGGLEGLTIRAVLKQTGLARRAFYEQFAGKDDLVLAVFEQAMRFAAQMYDEMVEPIADPTERLRTIIVSIGSGGPFREDAGGSDGSRLAAALSREHLRLAESRPDELHAALGPLIALLVRLLEAGMASGAVRQARAEQLAIFIYNLVATTLHTTLIAEETRRDPGLRQNALAEDLWEFVRRAIAA